MKAARSLVLLLVFACAARSAGGAEAPASSPAPRTVEDYLRLARGANAGLKAAGYRATAARERVASSGSFADPRLMYGYYVAPDHMEGRQEITFLQPFPFFGKRGLQRSVATREANAEVHSARATALAIDLEVKIAFYRFAGVSETAHVLQTEAEVLRRMRDVARVRYASGASEQQDVLKIELSLSRVADETTLNRGEIVSARARLNELIGRSTIDSLPDPEWALPNTAILDVSADSARARSPEVAIAREQIARAADARRLAKREYFPDFMLGFEYEFGAGEDGWWELMAGIDVPIWIGKRRAMVREAEAMRQSATYELEAVNLMTDREVEESAARARAALERYQRFESQILPQAQAAFESSEAGYRSGRIDFIDYLDSERMLLEFRKDFAMVRAELGTAIAELERAFAIDQKARDSK